MTVSVERRMGRAYRLFATLMLTILVSSCAVPFERGRSSESSRYGQESADPPVTDRSGSPKGPGIAGVTEGVSGPAPVNVPIPGGNLFGGPNSFRINLDGGPRLQLEAIDAQVSLPALTKPGPEIVRLLFGTNRTRRAGASVSPRGSFTGVIGDNAYGYVDVSVPPTHAVGEVSRPSIWKLEFSEDPTVHMMLRGLSVMGDSEFSDLVKQYKASTGSKPTVLFVHGFNVSFDDAALRTAQIAYDLNIDSVPAFFSWASRADPALYVQDENTALQSVPDFKKFLRMFASSPSDKVFLIAHSMGSRIVTQALTEMIQAEPTVASRVVQLVLAAPDLDAKVFKDQIVPPLKNLGLPVTLYASSQDKALMASSKIHGCCRAGLGGSNIVVADGIDSIDATSIDTNFLGHSYFAETRPLLTDMNLLFAMGMRASSRPLLGRLPLKEPKYYYFKK